MESHRKSKLHQAKLASSFLAADISLYKLNHPALEFLFAAMGKSLPSETAARTKRYSISIPKRGKYSTTTSVQKSFLIVDEAKVAKQKYINAEVSNLDTPKETFLIECLPPEN